MLLATRDHMHMLAFDLCNCYCRAVSQHVPLVLVFSAKNRMENDEMC